MGAFAACEEAGQYVQVALRGTFEKVREVILEAWLAGWRPLNKEIASLRSQGLGPG